MLYRYIFLSLCLLLAGISKAQQKSFTLTGTIQGKTGVYIYLSYTVDDGVKDISKKDSSLVEKGQFSFKGTLNGPAHAYLTMDRKINHANDKLVELFLVPGNLQLSLDYPNFQQNAVLKGSPLQGQADALEKSKTHIYAQRKLIIDAYRKALEVYRKAQKEQKEKAILDSLKKAADGMYLAMRPVEKQLLKIDLAFMDQHPTSFVTAYRLRYLIEKMSPAEAKERYGKLPEEIKNSSIGKIIKEGLDRFDRGTPGVQAFQFASTELSGGELKLSNYKGKYVLLDFWASWCVPCREGNPHLLSIYAKCKDKGLEIIGIADDDKKPEAWKKAVEQDGIGVWKHVLRGRLKTSEGGKDISDQYGIETLPTKILIDPKGIIIGRYAANGESDEAMDRKLAELFGN